jgi:hypothetical protein
VGDQDDGFALVRQGAQEGEELIGLIGRQDGGRLVENQDVGPAHQRLQDLDALLETHGERADDGIGIDGEAVVLRRAEPRRRGCVWRRARAACRPPRRAARYPERSSGSTSMKC